MSDLTTKKILSPYIERRDAHKPGFFTSFFNDVVFHNSAKIDLDVRRDGARIAPVLTALGVGNHRVESRKITNNEFTPPVYGLEFSLSVYDAMKRQIGVDPYADVNFLRNVQEQFLLEMPSCELMIRRGVELQCAQVLKSGGLTLPDATGATGFTLDYLPKSTHKYVGVSNDWDLSSGTTRLLDVRGTCNLVFNDSGLVPKYVIMGELAKEAFMGDAEVQNQILKTGTGIGEQVPPQIRNGGAYHGRVSVGQFVCEIWTATGFYESYPSGTATKYLGDWDVIVLGENATLTLTYGGIPRAVPVDPRLAPLAIGRASSAESRIDFNTNAWFSLDGTQLFGSVGARPLAIPKSIDAFASLNTKVT